MTTAAITAALRSLAMLRRSQGKELRARGIAATAIEIEELTERELVLVGLTSTEAVHA